MTVREIAYADLMQKLASRPASGLSGNEAQIGWNQDKPENDYEKAVPFEDQGMGWGKKELDEARQNNPRLNQVINTRAKANLPVMGSSAQTLNRNMNQRISPKPTYAGGPLNTKNWPSLNEVGPNLAKNFGATDALADQSAIATANARQGVRNIVNDKQTRQGLVDTAGAVSTEAGHNLAGGAMDEVKDRWLATPVGKYLSEGYKELQGLFDAHPDWLNKESMTGGIGAVLLALISGRSGLESLGWGLGGAAAGAAYHQDVGGVKTMANDWWNNISSAKSLNPAKTKPPPPSTSTGTPAGAGNA